METIRKTTTFIVKYLIAEITKRPRNYALGITTVLLLVFFIAIILIGVTKSPVVFLRLVETQTSEMDTVILSNGAQGLPFLNHTDLERRIGSSTAVTGVLPRWVLPATARPRFNNSAPIQDLSVRVLVVDTDAEDATGLGRAWPFRPLGRGECHVQKNIMNTFRLRANRGERIIVEFDIGRVLTEQGVEDAELPVEFDEAQARQLVADVALSPLNLTDDSVIQINSGSLSEALNTTLPAPLNNINTSIRVGDFVDALLTNRSVNTVLSTLIFRDLLAPSVEFHVVDSIDEPHGKYPGALGNVILVDYRQLVPHFFDTVCYHQIQRLSTAVPSESQILETLPLEQYAILGAAMFRNRIDIYLSDRRERARMMISATNDMMEDLGVRYNATFIWPIALALDGVYFFQLFLSQIFYSSVFIIAILAFLVVYILQVTSGEERSYENGMLRAMGLSTQALVQLLLSQGLSFAVPAVFFALFLVFIANAIAEISLESLTKISPRFTSSIPPYTIILPAVAGIVVPILSNIIPVYRAFGKSLRQSLDLYHVAANETYVAVTKLQDLGIAPWQTVLGLLLVTGGFLVYYMVPFAFIFDELFLFFMIMIVILLGMLIGLCMISQAFQPWLETTIACCLIPGFGRKYVSPDIVVRHVVLKNLDAHRTRNQLSYLMFTMSVASIVFGGVTFSLMESSIRQNTELFLGADVTVLTLNAKYPLDRARLVPALEKLRREGTVENFAFRTFGLGQHKDVSSTKVTNMINFPTATVNVYGVDRSYQESTFKQYFLTTDIESGFSPETAVDSLYLSAAKGSGIEPPPKLYTGLERNNITKEPEINQKYTLTLSCIMSSATKAFLSTSTESFGLLTYEKQEKDLSNGTKETLDVTFLYRPRALANKLPGFFVTSYQFGVQGSPFLVTIENFKQLLPKNTTALYAQLFVKIKFGVTSGQREDAVNRISTFVNPDFHTVQDIRSALEGTRIATNLLHIFLYFLTAVSMILDTIMLWLAFVTNVKTSSWSLAVLRSLGLTRKQMFRAFIYEALCLVISSFLVGMLIGILIAVTLALQFNLFTELPLEFSFPWSLCLAMFILCVGSAVIASYIPTKALVKQQIAQVLKSG